MIVMELWNELSVSGFVPVDVETDFGDGCKLPAISIGGHSMDAMLRGFVDRVDAWKEAGRNYFRVIDYKTGKKDFDYCDIFNGIGLQMLLYLFALESGGEKILGQHPVSAGVQYFPARSPLMSADNRLSEEEAGRILRYETFREISGENGVIAVAHHRNDQAETVIFNLVRGTKLKGTAGMEPVRGRVIRPLLDVTKQESLMQGTKNLEVGLREAFAWYVENKEQVNRKNYFEFIDDNLV